MSNLSILQQNTLAGLSDPAGHLYLMCCDKFCSHDGRTEETRAFKEACRFERSAAETFDYIVDNNPVHDVDEETKESLSRFLAARWFNNFMEA
ncbi:MAG: hypothetical protein AAGF48_14935 [Pseudomonadota bacterium]